MQIKDYKQSIFEQFARTGKAFSNANRIELLEILSQGEHTVEELSKAASLTVANTSQHLQLLRNAGLVTGEKIGQYVHYNISDDLVIDLLSSLRKLSKNHLAEVGRLVNTYLTVKDDLEPMDSSELLQRATDGTVTVLDVRPEKEYEAGHIEGAISIPLEQLGDRIDELKQNQEVVAYCRGPYCMLAYDAVSQLRKEGFEAHRLDEGFPEWRRAGKPVKLSE
ncbi:MAG: metalloregulator ArsR/SmtB family transcription factor [Thiotrichales bacterium]|jgi:rhodanese-related sulfurtransferase/DNA-binding transcriptional ArsR family regulator|nr:metalloregulator ArsR/SmtB family transcription factor [Thiotrichales bacterium]MBT3613443.1 metalloregulator ArsR/SmtB family transcription factor [Thiotrichales bacterium]MBT3753330.1 metalloregulator ArsR/SmtB family transcription factor [Thiotrichales bacterium]MBT3836956.1 metalloregulator ArsR/SmtB family transcription factor [Thiotrichales bacterium]MBT4152948.1 metalloregulator ArsR/SmtB family transcription factor [Thiotrichales bacterium]